MKPKRASYSYIDDDILCDILSRLQLKYLVRFKCVCKSWKSLIEKDQWLINLHHSRQLKKNPRLIFFISKTISESSRLLVMNLLMRFPSDESVEFENRCTTNLCIGTNHKEITTTAATIQAISNKDLLACEQVQKPINGMICLIDKKESGFDTRVDHAACLYNVITQEATPWIRSTYLAQVEKRCDLKKLDVSRTYEFGFDPITKDYKVICMWSIIGWELQKFEGLGEYTLHEDEELGGYWGDYSMCEILTFGNETAWRRIDMVPQAENWVKRIYGSTYANGTIYWIILKELHRQILVAFDVGCEQYRVMPDINFISLGRRCNFHLLDVDGHLAIETKAGDHTINLWILDDNCDKNTSNKKPSNIKWTKEIIILPLCWRNQYVRLHAVEGTEYLILELIASQSYHDDNSGKEYLILERFGVQCYQDAVFLHSYNRKKKTFSKIDITADGSPYSSLGAIIGYPPFKFTAYVESLLTLQMSYRPAIEAPDSSSTKRMPAIEAPDLRSTKRMRQLSYDV